MSAGPIFDRPLTCKSFFSGPLNPGNERKLLNELAGGPFKSTAGSWSWKSGRFCHLLLFCILILFCLVSTSTSMLMSINQLQTTNNGSGRGPSGFFNFGPRSDGSKFYARCAEYNTLQPFLGTLYQSTNTWQLVVPFLLRITSYNSIMERETESFWTWPTNFWC